MKNGTQYAVAFSRNGHATRLLNIPMFDTAAKAKAKVGEYQRDAKVAGHKNFGRTWNYVAVAITPIK